MMDLDTIDKNTEKATSVIDKIVKLLDRALGGFAYLFKKYWIIMIFIGIALFIYWAFTLPPIYQEAEYINGEYYDTNNYETQFKTQDDE